MVQDSHGLGIMNNVALLEGRVDWLLVAGWCEKAHLDGFETN